MVKIVLGLCLSFFISLNAISQSEFYDFENWQRNELYDEPENFTTFNFASFIGALQPNVVEVKGVRGSAIRIENKASLFSSDVYPGLLTNFDVAGFPAGGAPFNTMPDTLTGYIRFDFMPGDTGIIGVIFKRAGTPVSLNIFPIFGKLDTFLYFEIPLQQSPFTPDSVLFIAASYNLGSVAFDGSFIEIDEFKFKNTIRQIENSSFESYETLAFEEPEQWATQNFIPVILRNKAPVSKSSDSALGSFSMKIENIRVDNAALNVNQTFGSAYLGEAGLGIPQPIPFKVTDEISISCQYKYQPAGQDTGWLVVRPYYFDVARGTRVFLPVQALPLTRANNFSRAQLKYKIPNGQKVDSIFVEAYAGNYFDGIDPAKAGTPKNGSILWIDAVSLAATVGNVEISKQISLFPNPADNYIVIKNNSENMAANYRIFNQQVQSFDINVDSNNDQHILNISELKSGAYYLEQTIGNKSYRTQFIKK